MKAPEKIYINPNLESRTWLISKGDTSFIEYVRIDAFVEKACEFLKEEVLDDYAGIVWEELIEDFKNYMKGD